MPGHFMIEVTPGMGSNFTLVLLARNMPGLVSHKEVAQNVVGPCCSPFTEATDDICSSLIAARIGSYPTLENANFTQCDDLNPSLGGKLERVLVTK